MKTWLSGVLATRVLIVPEPPPHVTKRDFIALQPNALREATTERYKIGYDGWVKDITVSLPTMQESNLRELLDQVARTNP
jgi:hypothetical protein